MTDIEIARSINPKDITEVAKTLGIENKIELWQLLKLIYYFFFYLINLKIF